MKIGIVVGSHRHGSQSAKIGGFLAREIEHLSSHSVWTLDLGITPLPLWDEQIGSDAPHWDIWQQVREELTDCHAFIVVTPEWHGMVPAALKNFFLVCGGSGELAHKPALICSVSAGIGGSFPVNELRTSSYKNSRLCYIPEHLIIRNCMSVMNANAAENTGEEHDYLVDRARYALQQLFAYGEALVNVRASGTTSLEAFPNGM